MDENKPSTDNDPNSATTVTDLINITIKTIDSKNYKFQVENNVWKKWVKFFKKIKVILFIFI